MSRTFPLRLPESIRRAAQRLAREDGVSLHQFIATAVAEKVSALNAATDLRTRGPTAPASIRSSAASAASPRAKAMKSKGGEHPAPCDRHAGAPSPERTMTPASHPKSNHPLPD
jgi:hypothetical protein